MIRRISGVILAVFSLTGCFGSLSISNSNPGPHSELVTVVGTETPSRVVVIGAGLKKYYVDLAYIKHSSVACGNGDCATIKERMVGKRFWVRHEYDRLGLFHYTFWPTGKEKAIQPINIHLITHGGYARMADYVALPNGKSELVARATEVGASNEKLGARVKGLMNWQQAYVNKDTDNE